jgi:hypothetical protein
LYELYRLIKLLVIYWKARFDIVCSLNLLEKLTSFDPSSFIEKSNGESFEITLSETAIGPDFVPLALGFSGQMSPQKYFLFLSIVLNSLLISFVCVVQYLLQVPPIPSSNVFYIKLFCSSFLMFSLTSFCFSFWWNCLNVKQRSNLETHFIYWGRIDCGFDHHCLCECVRSTFSLSHSSPFYYLSLHFKKWTLFLSTDLSARRGKVMMSSFSFANSLVFRKEEIYFQKSLVFFEQINVIDSFYREYFTHTLNSRFTLRTINNEWGRSTTTTTK